MKTATILLLTLLTLSTFAAESDSLVALVGGRKITASEIDKTDTESLIVLGDNNTSTLDKIIFRELILLKYEQGEQKLPEWYFARCINEIIDNRFGGDKSQLVATLHERGITLKDWEEEIKKATIVQSMIREFVFKNVTVKPSDIQKVYDEKYANRTLSGPTRASIIIFSSENENKDKIIALAQKSFAEAAGKYSFPPYNQNGGDTGFIDPKEELREELANELSKMAVGEISQPISLGNLTFIVKKTAEAKDLKIPLAYVSDEIEEEIKIKLGAKRLAAWEESLKNEFTVRIYDSPNTK